MIYSNRVITIGTSFSLKTPRLLIAFSNAREILRFIGQHHMRRSDGSFSARALYQIEYLYGNSPILQIEHFSERGVR